jgi:hypothetical protein
VLNFNDISRWLNEEDILIEDCEDTPFERMDPRVNRLYPVTSGVISSVVATQSKQDRYRKFYVHGESNCIDLCQSMVRGEITGCFIEMNSCSGGCIKGPTVHDRSISRFKVKLDMEEQIGREPVPEQETAPVLEAVSLNKVFFDRTPHEPVPSEAEIRQILAKTGKMRPDDELNCGACGYGSCRSMAVALHNGLSREDHCAKYTEKILQRDEREMRILHEEREEDKRQHELVDARNQCDALIHTAKKAIQEHGDKVSAEEKAKIEAAIKEAEEVIKGTDKAEIEAKAQALALASQTLGEKMYSQQPEGPSTVASHSKLP